MPDRPYRTWNQSCQELPFGDNKIDSICTDPPYELFLAGNKWDASGIAYDVDMWREHFRVLKPGGHAVVFGHPKTVHRVKVAMEDAGFVIKDTLMWMYANAINTGRAVARDIDKALGKPRVNDRKGRVITAKGTDIVNERGYGQFAYDTPNTELAEEYDDWNTTLRPAYEPIILAQKPISEPTIAANIIKWRTGAINAGSARVQYAEGETPKDQMQSDEEFGYYWSPHPGGRYPQNAIMDRTTALLMEAQAEQEVTPFYRVFESEEIFDLETLRFAYVDKPSRGEKDFGCEGLSTKARVEVYNKGYGGGGDAKTAVKNDHPTCKPLALMRYLIKLVTPKGGMVLDGFMGSGSTGMAAIATNFNFVGVELSPDFRAIAESRLDAMWTHTLASRQMGHDEAPFGFKKAKRQPEGDDMLF
jgi:site-specific DNA-methyltransferase (adenine-specific)